MPEIQDHPNLSSVTSGLQELLVDEKEISVFQEFRSAPSNASRLHLGLQHESRYDNQRAVFRPLPSNLLGPLLEECIKCSDLTIDLKCNLNDCGWVDVLNCIDIAKASYDEKGKNKVRAWARHADTTASALESLVGLIPDDKGLSVLRGGLVFIFQAWQRRMKNREDILNQLEDVPLILSTAVEKWKLYPSDDKLKTAAQELCHTVIDSMTVLISILLHMQKGSFIAKSMQRVPAVELRQIDNARNSVEVSKNSLNACLERLDRQHLAYLHKTSTNNLTETKATRQIVHVIKNNQGNMMQMMHDIDGRLQEANKSRLQDEDTMKAMITQWFREFAAANMQTGFYRLFEETEYCRRLGYDTSDTTTPIFSKDEMVLTSKALLMRHLGLSNSASVEEDVENIRRQGVNVATGGLEHARKLMSMAQFNEWIGSDSSKLLLVDGHCQNFCHGKTSPLSVFCASLASTLSQSDSLVILQYFCGHHAFDTGERSGGPLGLIKSLLGQLLQQPDDVLFQNVRIDKRLYDREDHDDVDSLCEIFGLLFSQINPSKVTILMLDEISEFEGARDGWVSGICLVADQLEYMVHYFKGAQKLKVLMTSANKSVMVSPRLPVEERVSLRGDGLPNHSTGRLVMSRSDLSLPQESSQGSPIYETQ